ncbi:MAG: peptidylprolyl isomerase [Flavobacteriales bacterium]|nr:peptidylprolyl isomerase [Flavobacteriales bacterium]
MLLVLVGCSLGEHAHEPINRWADERLWPVLEAQEHRDTGKLCALLSDSCAVVREAAALAFASVQDSASTQCLLKALGDAEASVRSSAVFALAFVADSVSVQRLAEAALEERDSSVQRAYMNASFIAMQRNGMLKDPNAILYYMQSATPHGSARAADALRRLPDSLVYRAAYEISELMGTQETAARQFLILAMGKFEDRTNPELLGRLAVESMDSNEKINAMRAYAKVFPADWSEEQLYSTAMNAVEERAALDLLEAREQVDARACLYNEPQHGDTAMRIALLGLAIRHGNDSSRAVAMERLNAIATKPASPFRKAALMSARGNVPVEECLAVLRSEVHPAERQAAFLAAVRSVREVMTRSRFASREAQYAQLGQVVGAAINTGDAGLICATAELLQEEGPDVIGILFPASMEKAAFAPLQPIRDLEARILLRKAIAKRDGAPYKPPFDSAQGGRVPYNHPIDRAGLHALKQGQQYRIVTNKGEVVIATDVNECPSNSLAFDSLVTSGYYNGKYFHRMVPNFVVQGGCPRGDGYGGMPWTLRTEIGRTPFTAGSVGLASAGPDTESCQFFITHSAAPHLDGRYTRFGEVVSGMDVVWQLQVGDVMSRVERIE